MIELLTPAELGDVGEDLFQHLCSRARLTCNKSQRDRHGWDFRIEFSDAASTSAPLDKQRQRACLAQVKATGGETGTRVSARLSSIARLAKDPGPAVLIILRLRPNGEAVAGYLIHLIDDALARVLARLRRAEAAGRTDINHMTMSFDFRKGRCFKPTPEGLRDALAEFCVEDVTSYVATKALQIERLGYEAGGELEAEALVWIEDKDHLVRILSGLAPLRPIRMQAYDRRFGIRVPYQGDLLDGVEEFLVQSPSVGESDVVIRNGPRAPTALFRCEAFVPPPVEGAPLMLIKHPALTVIVREDSLELQTEEFGDRRRKLEDWIPILRGLAYLASGTGTIEIAFRGVRSPSLPVAAEQLRGSYLSALPQLSAFVEHWREALSLAGLATGEPFALDDIFEARTVHVALDILFSPSPVARIEFEVAAGDEGEALEALYFNSVTFAGTSVTFAVKVTFERQAPGGDGFVSTGYHLLDIRPAVTDLNAYGAAQADAVGLNIVFDPANLVFSDPATPAAIADDEA